MRKQKNAINGSDFGSARAKLLSQLVAWFERQRRVLPWREDPSPYRVWISEIMLQQTQVITVLPYFERFVARFPSVEDLAHAPDEDVMKAWAGLGYYSRARNIHRAAKQIVAEGFPKDREGWLAIPGVGPYTAGAICSIALDQAEALVDGNVERVLSRLFTVRRGKSDTEYKERLWSLARKSIEGATARKLSYSALNQGWMELGAIICTPKKPKCLLCPVRSHCQAFAAGVVEDFPEKKKPKEWIEVQEKRAAVFTADFSQVALVKAAEGEWRAGLWDFPEVLPRGWKLTELGTVESRHVVTRHKITRVTRALVLKGRPPAQTPVGKSGGGSVLRWVNINDPEVPLGSAPKKVLQLLTERWPG